MKARDDGFSLVEAVVGISMLALVLTATTPLFINGLQATAGLGGQQVAVTVASQQLEYIRSLPAAGLVSGRNATDVAALNASVASGGLVDLSNDNLTAGTSDATAAAGSSGALVPLTSSTTVASTTYTLRNFVNTCYLSRSTGRCTASSSNGPAAFRVSIDVSWPQRGGVRCPSGVSGQCEHVVTTIIDASKDPTFATTPPPTIASAAFVDPATSLPVLAVHPGQQVNLIVAGTNFAYGAVVTSNQADAFGSTISNLGVTLTIPFTPSSVTGSRTFTVTNPNATSGSTTVVNIVKVSTPTIPAAIGLLPGSATMNVARTFTLTGTDFFATPTAAAPTTQPTVTMVGTNGLGAAVTPTISDVTVTSSLGLTFKATFPSMGLGYTTSGTLRLTDPDGGTTTYSYLLGLS